jgi:hypothetical protein
MREPLSDTESDKGLCGGPEKEGGMNVIALLYAEFKRLEEELKESQGMKKWDERTQRHYLMLKKMFQGRK